MSIAREDLAIEVDEEIMRREGRARLNVEDRTVGPAGEAGTKMSSVGGIFTAEIVFSNIERPFVWPKTRRSEFALTFKSADLPPAFVHFAPPKPMKDREFSVSRAKANHPPVLMARPGSGLTLSAVIRHLQDCNISLDRMLVGMRVDIAVIPKTARLSLQNPRPADWLEIQAIRLDVEDLMKRVDDFAKELFGDMP